MLHRFLPVLALLAHCSPSFAQSKTKTTDAKVIVKNLYAAQNTYGQMLKNHLTTAAKDPKAED